MSMPAQKPHRSVQDVMTPPDFMVAFYNRFGPMSFDLAASKENSHHLNFYSQGDNALTKEWFRIKGNLWLNPPYEDIEPWAQKCCVDQALGANIFMLVPASVGSEWYRKFVEPNAYVFGLNPRLKFVGHKTCYPKDLILCMFSSYVIPGFKTWRWK